MDIHNIPVPLYFRAEKYYRKNKTEIDDFTALPRPFYTICHIDAGTLRMDGKTGKLNLKKGDMFLLPIEETYFAEWQGDPGAVFSSIHFTFSPENDPLRYRAYPLQKLTWSGRPEDAERIFIEIIQQYHKRGFEIFNVLSKFYSLCYEVFCGAEFKEIPIMDETVKKSVSYIEQNYNIPVAVGQLARLCNFSESRFYYLFKKSVGMTPIEYKNKIAVRRSMQFLIENPEITIEEVSSKCGFCNSSYFRKVFFKITGTTPSIYRSLNRGIGRS